MPTEYRFIGLAHGRDNSLTRHSGDPVVATDDTLRIVFEVGKSRRVSSFDLTDEEAYRLTGDLIAALTRHSGYRVLR